MLQRILIGSVVLVIGSVLLAGCLQRFYRVEAEEVDAHAPPVEVDAPLKVHLTDGSVALFPQGGSFTDDSLTGYGQRYPLSAEPQPSQGVAVASLPLDSVAALETYHERLRPAETLVASTAATVGATFGAALLAIAIFGSCPTIYTGHGEAAALQAEAFPNSIVPLFEMRDTDVLRGLEGVEGVVELDVRNEALETHYVNHLELLEVRHAAGTMVVPGEDGEALVLHGLTPPARATDRAGRDVLAVLADPDGEAYATPDQTLTAARADDLLDAVELAVPVPPSGEAAVYLRLRNSLLSTVFFYDFMLAGQGARALDWMHNELNAIGGAVRMGAFYREHMGLRVDVWEGGRYRQVGRVREVGPIAWDHVAVPVPVPAGADTLRLRLRFIADAWRIDRLSVAAQVERADARRIAASDVIMGDERDGDALRRVNRPDEDYLVTSPGERFHVKFEVGEAPPTGARSFFVATQGFYTEWMRGAWLRDAEHGRRFEPSDSTLHAAIEQWMVVKDEYEQRFFETKFPVR